ncbi:hypothetical protein [Streptomyces sp. MBT53]|uniref:hypothetical protein n=1 Tax=Streptomyces sp. MBT53 TaxID=1488384 RepID=UPI0019134E39|nr:hypothetical protein [Streptomyces sp. MBT53]MBK6018669.1 hypothetical protein [Streptomyces sp. MBT53]
MTALATDPTVRPRPARMWGAVLRLHRAALTGWAVLVTAVSAGLLWAYGPGGSAAYTVAEVLIGWVPYLAAAWAGTFVARELQRGTVRLAWTQGVTPNRWLATSLAVPAALLTAGNTVLVLLHRLVSDAHQVPEGWNPWNDETFTANGTLAIVHPLLGLAVGTLAGFLQRHAVTAAGLAIAAMGLALTTLGFARPHLWPTAAHVGNLRGGHYAGNRPASDFWPLQLVETGIVVAVAALVLGTAFALLRRRTS